MSYSKNKKVWKISLNAPLTLGFAVLCFVAFLINLFTGGRANHLLFSNYRSLFTDVFTYFRFFTHVLGHASWEHLVSNMCYILLLGPLLEEKYDKWQLLLVILITALMTGLVHFFFFPRTALLGASGVCFAFILLSSITGFKEHEIPITFILVAVIYLGQQIYEGIFVQDTVSNLSHIIGGLVGAAGGFLFNHRRSK